jgi:succinoglycan biosynthesis transport protein ExoP
VLAAPDLVEVALDALCETYDWVLVAAASSDDSAVLAPIAGRAQGGLVMAGQVGNGHAVEAAYRLSDLTKAPVALVLDAPPVSFTGAKAMMRQHDEEPA